jgi:hypothetical protein
MQKNSKNVIPAKAGIQLFQQVMDPRLREDDKKSAFPDRL